MNYKERKKIKKMVISGLCLALCMLLPFLTGQIPKIGQVLSPMHIPVLLCGFLCGPLWGGVVGFVAPALRFVLFQSPPLMPIGISMMFELATYGMITGLIYNKRHRKKRNLFLALFLAMLLGRIVWGAVMSLIAHYGGLEFTNKIFFAQAFVTAFPGIIFHILIIPPILLLIEKRTQLYD